MNKKLKSEDSKFWTLIYFSFVISFVILVIIFTERLIEEPSHDIADITIYYSMAIIFLAFVFSLALFYLYGLWIVYGIKVILFVLPAIKSCF